MCLYYKCVLTLARFISYNRKRDATICRITYSCQLRSYSRYAPNIFILQATGVIMLNVVAPTKQTRIYQGMVLPCSDDADDLKI